MAELPPSSPSARARPRGWRLALVVLGLLALVGALVFAGRQGWLPGRDEFEAWLLPLKDSPWGLPATILLFCVACYLAVPQTILILATISIFGPWPGAGYAFLANLCSGTLTFWVARAAGAQVFTRHAGPRMQKLSGFIGRNALFASALVRILPTGPFVVVNSAFAVSKARFLDYMLGLAIGIVPKIALIAFAGKALIAAIMGEPVFAAVAGLGAIVVLIGLNALVKRLRRRYGHILPETVPDAVDTGRSEPDR